ncbi:MAG TPA: FKBP-type peptidyl-prolyl cis-trans isomerase [Ktedonobacterales bacterium]
MADLTGPGSPNTSHTFARYSHKDGAFPRRSATTCWRIVGTLAILAAVMLAACTTVKQPLGGPSSPHSTGIGVSSCPTPTANTGVVTPPASPPAVKGAINTTGDGLQEIDVQVGCGAVVQVGQTVIVEYTGWVESTGKLFDSSFLHQPGDCEGTVQNTCSFALSEGSVIQGWVEGVAGMKIGGTRRLIIPPALAYGAQGSPPVIPPNATLIFDVTVVGVQ